MLVASADAATNATAPAKPDRNRTVLSTTTLADIENTSVATHTAVPIRTARYKPIRRAIGLAASAPDR